MHRKLLIYKKNNSHEKDKNKSHKNYFKVLHCFLQILSALSLQYDLGTLMTILMVF